MQRMTGGSLPAMTWHAVMNYAHQGIELKGIPGVAPNPAPGATPQAQVAAVAARGDARRPTVLTQRGAGVLQRLERLMDDASRALAVADAPSTPAGQQSALPRPDTLVAITGSGTTGLRGN